MGKSRVKEDMSGRMVVILKEIGSIIRLMVKVFIIGLMAGVMLVNG